VCVSGLTTANTTGVCISMGWIVCTGIMVNW